MNSLANSIFVIVLVCIDSAAVAKLVIDGVDNLSTSLALHVLVCAGACIRGAMHPGEGALRSSRIMMAINCALTCWFAPIVGVLVTLFYDHAEPVEAKKQAVKNKSGFVVENPVTGGGRPVLLENLEAEALFPLTEAVFNGRRIRGEEGIRTAVRLRTKGSLLIVRRLAGMLKGRRGIVVQTGLQEQLERDRWRVRMFSRVLHDLEIDVDPVWHLIAANGESSLIGRGINSVAVENSRIERIAEHLGSAIFLGAGDAWVVNQYVDALIKLEDFEEAYRVVMECSVVEGVPVRLHLARIRAAEGQWTGINSLTSDVNNRDWADLSVESKNFWGF